MFNSPWFPLIYETLDSTVLRIHLILMRILDPHWKKMNPESDPNPDPRYFFKIYWIILTKQNFLFFVLFLFEYFYAKTWRINQKLEKLKFWKWILFAVFGWYFAPWIRIFLPIRIRIQEAKILRTQRIRILSTG